MMMITIIIPLLSFHVPCVIYARYFTPLGFSRPFSKRTMEYGRSFCGGRKYANMIKRALMDLHSKIWTPKPRSWKIRAIQHSKAQLGNLTCFWVLWDVMVCFSLDRSLKLFLGYLSIHTNADGFRHAQLPGMYLLLVMLLSSLYSFALCIHHSTLHTRSHSFSAKYKEL